MAGLNGVDGATGPTGPTGPVYNDNGYIRNQYTSAQTPADYWISGSGRIDVGLTVGDGMTLDNNDNNGVVSSNALAFGNSSGEGIASNRTTTNQLG